jgi:hypothetical protein
MFRSIFDHPQGDIFSFTSVTKDKIIWFVVACLLYLLCFVLMLLRAVPSLVVAIQQQPDQFGQRTISTISCTISKSARFNN